MRSIPAALKTKLLNRFKAESTDSEPHIRMIAKQTSFNTLLTEPIHKDIAPSFGDVTVRQLSGESEPSLAYAICLDLGIANIYSRQFPSDEDYPWKHRWTLGEANDVAIEYNGVWTIDVSKEWYYLQTEEYPYVFFVDLSGNLYVQHWMDETTRTHLAEGVSEISACRGWQSTDEPDIDQGLIIGYLRDGKVYYRAWCYEETGEMLWETERQVAELGENNVSLTVFRTNDFRVGFLAGRSDGTMHMALTGRSYAGQSVRPETAVAQVVRDCRVTIKAIDYLEAFGGGENFTGKPTDGDFYVGNFMTEQTCTPISSERISSTVFRITFDHVLLKRKPFEAFLKVTLDTDTATSIIQSVETDGYDLVVTTSREVSGSENINVELLSFSRLCFWGENAAPFPVPNFTFLVEPSIYYQADRETVTANMLTPSVVGKAIDYIETDQEDSGTVGYTARITAFAITQVGDVPV